MKKHICKNCGRTFEYCRGCLLLPIPYKGAGFCSKECQDAFNKKSEEVTNVDLGVVLNDKGIETTSENE